MKKSNVVDYGSELSEFKLSGIEVLSSEYRHPQTAIPEKTTFNFDIKIDHRASLELKLLFVLTEIKIFIEPSDSAVGSIKVSCSFSSGKFDSLVDIQKNELKLSEEFVLGINTISISTSRGIMFSEFKGTFLHNAFLPLVDPRNFLGQSVNPDKKGSKRKIT